jgi:hypothetical protein
VGIQPNKQFAAQLRTLPVIPQMSNSVALRDYMVGVAENGVAATPRAEMEYLNALVSHLFLSQMDVLDAFVGMQSTVQQLHLSIMALAAKVDALEKR